MKILMLLPSLGRGGAEQYGLTIAKVAMQQGWEVHCAFSKVAETMSLSQDYLAHGICYHALPIGEIFDPKVETPIKHLGRLIVTLGLLLRLRPDVVQIILPWPNLSRGSILACGMLKIPTIVTFQLASQVLPFSPKMQKVYAWARSRLQRWVAVSDHNRQILCDSFNMATHEILRIYNGTNAIKDSQANPATLTPVMLREKICRELGITIDSYLAVSVGRLCWQKGYHSLIPVIPHLVKEFPNLKLLWIGDGELKVDLMDKIKHYGVEEHVLLLGYRTDIPQLLRVADLFVFPTLYEGHPFALLEAMATGCPVIASDASSIPEIIQHHEHGLLFRAGDSDDLLGTMRWAMQNQTSMAEMALKGQQRSQDFSEEQMIQETLDLFSQCAE